MNVIAMHIEPQGHSAYAAGPIHLQTLLEETDLKNAVTFEEAAPIIQKEGELTLAGHNKIIKRVYDGTVRVSIAGHVMGEVPMHMAVTTLAMGLYVSSLNNLIYLMTRYRCTKVCNVPEIIIARSIAIKEEPTDATEELYPG